MDKPASKSDARRAIVMERVRMMKIEQIPIVQDLARVGIYMQMVNEEQLDSEKFTKAAPIFLRHMRSSEYSEVTLESMAGLFGRKDASKFWGEVADIYRAQPLVRREKVFDSTEGLASALGSAATKRDLPELIDMLRDRRLRNRILLLAPLKRRRRDPAIAAIIEELREDPELTREIDSWPPLK